MGYVYQIRNTKSEKVYIGSTININKRKSTHFNNLKNNSHHCVFLQRSYNKNNPEDFIFEIIYEGDDYINVEQQLITEKYDNIYNTSKYATGGDLISYHPNRTEIIEKIRSSVNERYKETSERMKHSKPMDLNPNWKNGSVQKHTTCSCGNTKNYNAKVCIQCIGNYRKGESNSFYGKQHSEESKLKMSIANKGKIPINANKVSIDGIVYPSKTTAAKEIGVSVATIQNRINSSKYPNYKLL